MPQVAITTWPSSPLPEAAEVVSRMPIELVNGRLRGASRWEFQFVPVPTIGEVLALDLSNETAVVRFAYRHGTMNLEAPFGLSFREASLRNETSSSDEEPGIYQVFDRDFLLAILAEHPQAQRDRDTGRGETLKQFREQVMRLQWMVKAVRLIESVDSDPADRSRAAMALHLNLNAALVPFHAEIRFLDEHEAVIPTFSGATLYQALALQIFNHLIRGIPYRDCANETCGKLFDVQTGRAEHGQYRSDAIYCSRACARAQVQRMYHRRQVKEEAHGKR
jgi:hypothetical protein